VDCLPRLVVVRVIVGLGVGAVVETRVAWRRAGGSWRRRRYQEVGEKISGEMELVERRVNELS